MVPLHPYGEHLGVAAHAKPLPLSADLLLSTHLAAVLCGRHKYLAAYLYPLARVAAVGAHTLALGDGPSAEVTLLR